MINFKDSKNLYSINKNLFDKKNIALSTDKVKIELCLYNFLSTITIIKRVIIVLFENQIIYNNKKIKLINYT